jgi:hypothetical protein
MGCARLSCLYTLMSINGYAILVNFYIIPKKSPLHPSDHHSPHNKTDVMRIIRLQV